MGIRLEGPFTAKFEWAPAPASKYLDDKTSFDMYIQGFGPGGKKVGVGIEVKYTEKGYRSGNKETAFIRDPKSVYWTIARKSDRFKNGGDIRLTQNDLRQIWRNHLLGLAVIQMGDVSDFVSVTLYPSGNEHFTTALRDYKGLLKDQGDRSVCGCTYEKFIDCLSGDAHIKHWRDYLVKRYLVK
jgi:hypothetical protein